MQMLQIKNYYFHIQNNQKKISFSFPRMKVQDTQLWDSFQDPPKKAKTGSNAEAAAKFESIVKVFKVIVAIIVFIVILGSTIISKMTILFMTTHIKPDKTVQYCDINRKLIP